MTIAKPRRIVILGCSGSGKSTLARRLADRLGFPAVHLDVLYWRPGWREPDPDDFLARIAAAHAGDAWVSEGNYRETFPLRLPRADLVIILDAPRWLRLVRVIRRIAIHRGADLPEACPERMDWVLLKFIWWFDTHTWPRIDAAREAHGPAAPVVRLRNKRQIAAFLGSLP
jgi:adenylate kinase family enzyme